MENKEIIQKIQENQENNKKIPLGEKELLAVHIYESQLKNGVASFIYLKETYNYEDFKLSVILDQLNDLCLVNYKLSTVDKLYFCGFVIDKPFIPMVRYWYKKSTNNNQKILKDSSENLENKGKDKTNDTEDLSTKKLDEINNITNTQPEF